jgi:hypothetical protein
LSSRPKVLVLDDGDLGRIRQALAKSKVDLEHQQGEVLVDDLEGPYDAVFATVKRTLAFEGSVDLTTLPGKPVWVAVHGQDFLPLRVRLRKMGVSFLIQTSVGAEALQLFLMYTIHQGRDKRGTPRLPVGLEVTCREEDGDPFQANLLDISQDGCRLVSDHPVLPGAVVAVDLPAELSAGEEYTLSGPIQRAEPLRKSARSLLTVSFEHLDPESLKLVEAILAGKVIGTVVTRLGEELAEETAPTTVIPKPAPKTTPAPPKPAEPRSKSAAPRPKSATPRPQPAEPRPEPQKPKRQRRVVYSREVTALMGGSQFVVLARDLSIGGMRGEPLPELQIGTKLELAIYGPSGAEPVLVQAVVARDDGPAGTIFHFASIPSGERTRLEQIVARAPEIRSLEEDQADAPITIAEVRKPRS